MYDRCICGKQKRSASDFCGRCRGWDACPSCGERKKKENDRCQSCRTEQQRVATRHCICGVLLVAGENWSKRSQRHSSNRCNKCVCAAAKRQQAAKGKEFYAIKRRAFKVEVMAAYGGKCACCGETEIAFLSIDHKRDNGADHRREIKSTGGEDFYRWLRERGYPQDDFQCLCMNCNWAKSRNFWGCPHEAARLKLVS